MKLMSPAMATIDRLGQPEVAAPERRLAIRLLVWMGVLMSGGGLLWGTLAVAYGSVYASLVPFGYVVITVCNLALFHRTKRFDRARIVQLSCSLLLPFLFQLALGGFIAGGVMMLWAMLALVGSLSFSSPRETVAAMVGYVGLTCVAALLDPLAAQWARTTAASPTSARFIVLNVCLVTCLVFGLTSFFDQRRKADNAALRDANRTISALNEELAHSNRAKSTFLANMSHELRTPLNAILGYSEMLEEEPLPESCHRDVRSINRAGSHLLGIINQVLDLAKIESGTLPIYSEDFEVSELVHEAVSVVMPQVLENGNDLDVEVEPATWVRGDPQKLRQALVNLVGNAAKFTEEGRISVRVVLDEGALRVTVRDTGIGMNAATLERVCRPFQQADASTTRRFGGTGLGLHIVDQLVRMQQGHLELRSALGQGTTVIVEVPVTEVRDLVVA